MAKRLMKKRALRNAGRRGLSAFMALVMLISMIQISAFAAGESSEMQIYKQAGNDVYYEYDAANNTLVLKDDGTQTEEQVTNRAENPEILISKTIAGTSTENKFEITLNVETTQNVVKSSEYPDAAVSIVLDVSGSMGFCSTCGNDLRYEDTKKYYCTSEKTAEYMDNDWDRECDHSGCGKQASAHYIEVWCDDCDAYRPQRLQANKTAAKAFLDTYAASASYTDGNGDPQTAKRYISLVTYNTDATSVTRNGNTPIWIDVAVPANLTAVKNTIDSLTYNGGTDVGAGLSAAWNSYLSNMPLGSDSQTMSRGNAFVLLLGDGAPDDNNYANAPWGNYARYNSDHGDYRGTGYSNAEKWARKIRTEGTKILAAYSGSNSNDKGYEWFDTFTNQCALCSNVESLRQTFNNYVTLMRLAAKAWEVHDPMGINFTYDSLVTSDAHITPNDANTEITWTLRADEPEVYEDNDGQRGRKISYDDYLAALQSGSDKVYRLVYTAKYYVTLNPLGTGALSYAPTNGATYLTYYLVDENGKAVNEAGQEVYDGDAASADGKQPMPKLYFKVPAAKALSAGLTFTKTSTKGDTYPLQDAQFQLYYQAENEDGDLMENTYGTAATSLENGAVAITPIPSGSGQDLVLKETVCPDGYTKAEDMPYSITVEWGQITAITDANGDEVAFSLDSTSDSGFKTYALNDTVKDPFDPAYRDFTVTKNWHVPSGTTLPQSITVTLVGSDGEEYTETMTGTGTSWSCIFEDLPTVDTVTGNPISYSVSEDEIAGYTPSYNNSTLTITNTWVSSYTVSKEWVVLDGADTPNVKVALLQNGNPVDSLTVTLSDSNNWTHTFENVPYADAEGTPYTYTVAEQGTDSTGSKVWVSGGQTALDGVTYDVSVNGFTITNKLAQEYIDIAGTKTWVGPIPSDKVAITLFADNEEVETDEITASDLNYLFEDMPRYAYNGNTVREIVYHVEDNVDGYNTEGGTKDANGEYNLTNTIEQEYMDIDVTKVWEDSSNAYDSRVDVTLTLTGNGATYSADFAVDDFLKVEESTVEVTTEVYNEETGETTTVTTEETVVEETWLNTLTKTIENVPKYDSNGQVITYVLTENDVVDGVLTGTNYVAAVNGRTVTNTLDGDTTSRTVAKVWKVPADSMIPASLDVTITGTNGFTETQTLSAESGWTYTWNSLEKYNNGTQVEYTITEAAVEGFTSQQSEDGLVTTFTNTIVDPANLTVTGTKSWQDKGAVRPEGNITVYLQSDEDQDGIFETVAQQTISTADGQTYTFANLPLYAYDEDADGVVTVRFIDYKVTDSVTGYTSVPTVVSSSAANEENTVTSNLSNSFDQTFTYVEGTKTWVDGNSVNDRPEYITVGLFRNGTLVEGKRVTAANGWNYSFGKIMANGEIRGTLPELSAAGTAYTYTVREMESSEDPTGIENGAIFGDYIVTYPTANNITNTRSDINATRTISVTKFWRGPIPADDITVDVYADGGATPVDTITLEASSSTSWSGTSSELPKYNADGSAIVYTIKETGDTNGAVEVDGLGYDVTYNQETYTLTNTIQQVYTSVSGLKTWDMGESSANLPETLKIALYADGQYTQPIATTTTSAEDEWQFTFGLVEGEDGSFTETLPVYDLSEQGDGHEIVYTVRELDLNDEMVSNTVRFGGKEYAVSYYDENNNIVNTFTPAASDTYAYEVWTHYLSYDYNNVLKGETTENPVSLTTSYDSTSFTVNPGSYSKANFTYQPAMSTLYIGAENQDTASFPAGTDTVVTVDQANKVYKVDLYYTMTEEKPITPPPTSEPDRTVTVHYLEVDTENVLHAKYSIRQERYTDYDVTEQDAIAIQGYTYVETTGDALSGTLDRNKVIYVWYTKDEVIEEEPTPITPEPEEPPVEIPEEEPPKADAPQTGDELNFWVATAAASALGLAAMAFTGKKRKEEEAI